MSDYSGKKEVSEESDQEVATKTTDSKTEDLDPELLYEQQFSVDDYIDESDYEEDAFYSTKKYHES